MRALILIATLTAIAFGIVASAHARNCTTYCGARHSDGSQTCNTTCW